MKFNFKLNNYINIKLKKKLNNQKKLMRKKKETLYEFTTNPLTSHSDSRMTFSFLYNFVVIYKMSYIYNY